MPKMTKVFGPERTNLMYAIIGHLMEVDYASVTDLAERFGYTPQEIRDAARTIGVAEVGSGKDYVGMPFELNYDALEDEDIVEFISHSVDMATPRLTTKQTAAISAGLKVLEQIPGFEHRDDVATLLAALHSGSGSLEPDTIVVSPGQIDSDVARIRAAIVASVAISCDYRNGRGELTTNRVIEPLRLESRDQVWYLRGYCVSKAHEVRVFRLDAMDKVTLTDRPIDAEHKALPLDDELYSAGSDAIAVAIEVDPEGYAILSDYRAETSGALKGTVVAEIKVTDIATLPPVIASYGGSVRVIAPAEAREAVRDFALRALGENSPERSQQEAAD